MPDTRDLVDQVEQGIRASKTTSATPRGRTDPVQAAASTDRKEAINQVFTLFLLNYHNQFYAAYPNDAQLNQVKRLWLEALTEFSVEQILRGAKLAIEESEYLPTLKRMLDCCRQGLTAYGLPSVRDAYVEACRAGSPKSAQAWSHAAVYLAGRDSDWFFLAGNREDVALPVFRRHYEGYCARVMHGETLEIPRPEALERKPAEPLSREEQLANLRKLRRETGL